MDTLQWKEHVPEYIKREDWVALCDIWAGDRWVERSAKMKVNRATHPEANVHTAGSVSFATQKARLETQLQRPPNFEEAFDHCHKRKGTGDYVSDKARQIAESYQKGMEEKYREHDQRPQLDPEVCVEATGPPKKGKVYGFGHSLGGSTVLASTSTVVSHATSPFSTPTRAPSTVNPEQMAQQITENLSQQLTQSLSQQLAQTVTQMQSQMSHMMQSQMSQMFGQMQEQMSQQMSQHFSQLGVHPPGAPPTQQHQGRWRRRPGTIIGTLAETARTTQRILDDI